MERDGNDLDPRIRSIAARIADEAFDEARAEVKALLKERLLTAALDRLEEQEDAPVASPRSRGSSARDIDETVRAIASSASEGDDPGPRFAEDDWGLWVYGVVPAGAMKVSPDGVQPGEPVRSVPLDGVDAVVSRIRLADFDAGAEEPDVAALAERAVAHERVLSDLLESGATVLPLRFGTVFRDEDDLRSTLAGHRAVLARALDRLRDRAEFEVKVLCGIDELERRVSERNERVAAAQRAAPGGEGAAFLHGRRVDRVLAEETQRAADMLGADAVGSLSTIAEEIVPAAGTANAEGQDVLRADAYLVPRDAWPEFRRAAAEVEGRLADRGVTLRVAGPLPPYRFTSFDLREVVDA